MLVLEFQRGLVEGVFSEEGVDERSDHVGVLDEARGYGETGSKREEGSDFRGVVPVANGRLE